MKITNIKPKQIKPIPWGWENQTMPDGTEWVSKSPGEIKMPYLPDYFDFSSGEYESIPELPTGTDDFIICSVNMKSVFTTACRFLGTEEAMIRLADNNFDLHPIFMSMLKWNIMFYFATKWRGLPIKRFIVGDEIGTSRGMMISPEHYEKYIYPYHKGFSLWAINHDIDPWFHSDGDISEVFPLIRAAGFTGVYYEKCGNIVQALIDAGLKGIEVIR